MSNTQWNSLHRRAKLLESRLEVIYCISRQLKTFSQSLSSLFIDSELPYRFLFNIQSKVQKYSSLAQKINADFLCDEGKLHPMFSNSAYTSSIKRVSVILLPYRSSETETVRHLKSLKQHNITYFLLYCFVNTCRESSYGEQRRTRISCRY